MLFAVVWNEPEETCREWTAAKATHQKDSFTWAETEATKGALTPKPAIWPETGTLTPKPTIWPQTGTLTPKPAIWAQTGTMSPQTGTLTPPNRHSDPPKLALLPQCPWTEGQSSAARQGFENVNHSAWRLPVRHSLSWLSSVITVLHSSTKKERDSS